MSKARKNTAPRPGPETSKPKAVIQTTYGDAMSILASHANKVVKEQREKHKNDS